MSRAGASPPVSPRPGVDAIKGVGGLLPAASSCAACIDTEGLEPVCLVGTGVRLTRRALSSAVRCVPLDEAVLGARRGEPRFGDLRASPRPDLRDVACKTMRTAPEASRFCRPVCGEAEPRPRDGAGLRCPRTPTLPLRFFGPRCACRRCASVRELAMCRSAECRRV